MALQDVIIAKARINNVYQSSNTFVQHLIWENSATSSFSLVMLSGYFKILQNIWESIRSYNVGNSQRGQIQLYFYVISKLYTRPCALLCYTLCQKIEHEAT